MTTVLDASALLAYLKGEPGADSVEPAIGESVISSINWSEVVQKVLVEEVDVVTMTASLVAAGLKIEPFTQEDAERAARLWVQTKRYGLSLGDRACISLGSRLDATVLTSDRAWSSLDVDVEVQLVR